MTWWEPIVFMASGMVGVLTAVLLGGWLVFRTKTITMPSPFIQDFKKKGEKPHSYVEDLYKDEPETIFDEELSSAASRLRDQKMDGDEKEKLRLATGDKK